MRGRNAVARLTEPFAPLNSLVAEQVVAYVNALVTSPRVQALSRIDVAELIDRAFDTGARRGRAYP